jgi:hypothetical protein
MPPRLIYMRNWALRIMLLWKPLCGGNTEHGVLKKL